MSIDGREELSSLVYVKLLQHDGAILRKFRGDSSLRTFLVVVVRRVLLDSWIAKRGKWRPSSEARQLGQVARELERLVFRDGMSVGEAGETLRAKFGVTDTDDEMAFLLSLLPCRPRRRFVRDAAVENRPSPAPDPLELLIQRSADSRHARLKRALMTLDSDDRRLLSLRFDENRTAGEIARLLDSEPKAIYRRCDRIFRQLRMAVNKGASPARAR
jgi:RNA polymerase sigma factor for flagellar operon FliA